MRATAAPVRDAAEIMGARTCPNAPRSFPSSVPNPFRMSDSAAAMVPEYSAVEYRSLARREHTQALLGGGVLRIKGEGLLQESVRSIELVTPSVQVRKHDERVDIIKL